MVTILEMNRSDGAGLAFATFARFVGKLATGVSGRTQVADLCKIIETETNGN